MENAAETIAEGVESLAPQIESAEEGFISVYHASVNNLAQILEKGLDPNRLPVFVSRDIAAAEDALAHHLDVVEELAGIVESRIPSADFQAILAPLERTYRGFYPYLLKSTEILLRTVEQVELFNRHIVR